jgi:hypothetical protein
MTYIPDWTERDYPKRKKRRYYDEDHDEVYVGKFDEGDEDE